MKKIPVLHSICMFSLFCSAANAADAEYSISSIYTGAIGKSNVTMNLIATNDTVVGSYIYDKYKKKIFISGALNANSLDLKEKTSNGTASIALVLADGGYSGKWCDKKCIPVILHTNNSFRDGDLKSIRVDDSDEGSYKIKIVFDNKEEVVTITDAIDLPSLEFVDINDDGFYDLIARTDHRPSNGSQVVYISSEKGFAEDKTLSMGNGTFVYDPYKKNIVFNSKDDCCNNFSKIVYSFKNGKAVKINDMSFDYSSNKGKDSKGDNISKVTFESY